MSMEKWRAIDGFEGRYEVSNRGRVRGLDRLVRRYWGTVTYKGKVLKLTEDGDGYLKVTLGKNGPQPKVHLLVARAFLPNPENLPEVDHWDRDHQNNSDTNLRWCTKSVNSYNKPPNVTVSDEKRAAIKAAVQSGVPIMKIAADLAIARATVRRIGRAEN